MAQQKIKFNDIVIKQPVTFKRSKETTFAEDSNRDMTGVLHAKPKFTVEAFNMEWKHLSLSEMSTILQIVDLGETFQMTYLSPYYGTWRTDTFYVGEGSEDCGCIEESGEFYDSLTFNAICVNPLQRYTPPVSGGGS